MYPSDVPGSRKECTPNVRYLDFQKLHWKNEKWQLCLGHKMGVRCVT
jgi:hypothetical protein